MRHVYECPVRWADLDALGHVNNVVYVDYLQEARVDMFRSHAGLPAREMEDGLVVARTQVRYREPLLFRFDGRASALFREMASGAVKELATIRRTLLQHSRDIVKGVIKDLVQQKNRALRRREHLQ